MSRARVGVVLGAAVLAGCSFTSTVEIAGPAAASPGSAPVASMRTMGSEVMGFDESSLTSHAALVKLDDKATCVDMVLRHPGGSPIRSTDLAIEVDGEDALTFRATFDDCKTTRCLPEGSPLAGLTTEIDDRVGVEGSRMCFQDLPRAHHDLSIGRRGVFAWKFRFRFEPEAVAERR